MVKKGRKIDGLSLPQPWADVALYLVNYIIYEGREIIVFNYHFPLLNHLRHQKMMNLPYLLLENIRHMVVAVKTVAHLENYIKNHNLVKIIVLDALSHQGKS